MHSYQAFLMIFLQDKISDHQHGFYRGRGTKTAWKEVLNVVLNAENIYEFDLKGFFPSVDVQQTVFLLEKEYGMPEKLTTQLLWMSQTPPKLPAGDYEEYPSTFGQPMDESSAIYKHGLDHLGNLHKKTPTEVSTKGKPSAKAIKSTMEILGTNPKNQLGNFLAYSKKMVKLMDQSKLLDHYISNKLKGYNSASIQDNPDLKAYIDSSGDKLRFEGFPQGNPISPILCSLVLGCTVFSKGECVMYADDGLFYGSSFAEEIITQTDPIMKKFGISFAPEKSGWVKKKGEWLKPLKFLGITFDPAYEYAGSPAIGILKASTRKGASLVFDRPQLITDVLDNKDRYNEDSQKEIPSIHED